MTTRTGLTILRYHSAHGPASLHAGRACADWRTPSPLTAWQLFETLAVGLLARVRLLAAWYAVAGLVLRACPPLARAVLPLRTAVLSPSLTGGEGDAPIPLRDGRVLRRGMFFGGPALDEHGSECARPERTATLLRFRRRARHVELIARGWHMMRSERTC